MMRNTISRPAAPVSAPYSTQANPDVPSIRLIAATPSASGLSSEASTSMNSSWTSVPSVSSPIAPKNDDAAPRKRLVPKKSKLGLLGVGSSKEKDKESQRGKDLSDVVRRVGASSSSRRGFDIYVDPADDPEIGEILMVKKKKSRAGFGWYEMGYGRRRSRGSNEYTVGYATSGSYAQAQGRRKRQVVEYWTRKKGLQGEGERKGEGEGEDQAPEPFKSVSDVQSRARFNSLDSGIVLNSPTFAAPAYDARNISNPQLLNVNVDRVVSDDCRPAPISTSRSATPTMGGLLAPPSSAGTEPSNNQGSIALRAMRSMRSLAHIGSWAQLKNGAPGDDAPMEKKDERKGKENDKKTKAKGEKKFKDKDESTREKKKTKKDKDDRKEKEKEKKGRAQTVRGSSSSFEVGALTASPEAAQTMMKKKRSILGLGLPSTMRLPAVRSGSTTSSIGAPSSIEGNVDNNRLSVESAVMMAARARSGSCLSTASSLRPFVDHIFQLEDVVR
ncbi:hypothetical protein D9758_018162 [Tetrapyrgos nigripes]|uniref:Uncharacterized protein n=1 Tax=Tetrapyrgos nigripes TaxID=182062 RepID=A0A8H5C2G9_9AGAR|nr:hypothetical protein D9758_018162 [Tetrapyrgos nigripes]